MKVLLKEEVVRKVEFHKLSIRKSQAVLLNMLEDYCEHDHDKYLLFLKETKKLIDECCEGYGVKV